MLYSTCRDLLFTKVYIKQGHEFLSEQQGGGLRLRAEEEAGEEQAVAGGRTPGFGISSACTLSSEQGPQTPLEYQEVLSFSLFVFTITF